MSDSTDAKITATGYSDEQFLIANNTFEVDGYEFQSWNTKPDGTGETILPSSYKLFQIDTALYAQWKLVYVYMQLVRWGEIKVESNIASGFTSKAGVHTPDAFKRWDTLSSFDLVLCITTGDDVTTKQVLLRLSSTHDEQLCIENGKLVFTSGGSSKIGSAELKASTSYFLKVVKSGSSVQFCLSDIDASYKTDLASQVKFNATSSSDYLEFGAGYDYSVRDWYDYSYTAQEPYTYTVSDWITKRGCTYYKKVTRGDMDSNCSPHKGKRGCGYYSDTVYTIYKTVTKTDRIYYYTYYSCAGFDGSIDFNQSYFMLDGLKHKLRV